jgi:hypothetical protein
MAGVAHVLGRQVVEQIVHLVAHSGVEVFLVSLGLQRIDGSLLRADGDGMGRSDKARDLIGGFVGFGHRRSVIPRRTLRDLAAIQALRRSRRIANSFRGSTCLSPHHVCFLLQTRIVVYWHALFHLHGRLHSSLRLLHLMPSLML